jgi:ribosomal protein L7/L12
MNQKRVSALVTHLKQASISDLVAVADNLKEKDGLEYLKSIAAVFSMCADEVSQPTEVPQEKRYLVILSDYDRSKKIATIKTIRAHTKLGLKESHNLVVSCPSVVMQTSNYDRVNAFVGTLYAVGAKASIEFYMTLPDLPDRDDSWVPDPVF